LDFFLISSLAILFNLIFLSGLVPLLLIALFMCLILFLIFLLQSHPSSSFKHRGKQTKRHMCVGVCLAHRQQPKCRVCAWVCSAHRHDGQASGIRSLVGTALTWRLGPVRCSLTTCPHQKNIIHSENTLTIYNIHATIQNSVIHSEFI
jgi:hypothetical protein